MMPTLGSFDSEGIRHRQERYYVLLSEAGSCGSFSESFKSHERAQKQEAIRQLVTICIHSERYQSKTVR